MSDDTERRVHNTISAFVHARLAGAPPHVLAALREHALQLGYRGAGLDAGAVSEPDELGALRKRVAELEAGPDWAELRRLRQLADAAARAHDARDHLDESAAKRIAELEALLAKVIKPPFATNSAIVAAEAGPLDNRFALFAALRDELREAHICLACGAHTPGRSCQCENDD